MTTKFNLTINPLTAVLLIGLVVCLVIIFRSCQYDPGEEIGRLQGEVEARDEQIKVKEQGLAEIKAERDQIVAEKDSAIDSANTVIALLEKKDNEKKERIARLEEEAKVLQDTPTKILNLQAQLDTWKERFSLAESKLKEKDSIIFSLKDQVNQEKELRIATEVVLEDYKKTRAVRDELITELEKKLHSKSRWQTLERLAFVGVAGLFLYNAVS